MRILPNVNNTDDLKNLEIEFEPLEEDCSPEDTMDMQDSINYVREQYNNGNQAAWFCAKVTVKYKDFEATDYLGCCSYGSFKEFKQDAYYLDMVNTCINEVNRDIENYNRKVQRMWDIRRAKNLVKPYNLIITSLTTIPHE